MSDSDLRPYTSPLTGMGIALAECVGTEVPELIIHEAGYITTGSDWNFEKVQSPFWRLYYNFRSGNFIECADEKWPLLSTQILLVPEDLLFDCRGKVKTPHLWIHFSIQPTLAFKETHPLRILLRKDLRLLLDRLVQIHSRRRPSKKVLLHHGASALLHACLAQKPLVPRQKIPDRLSRTIQLIQSAPARGLSNPFLAQQASMSVEAFIRWFKRHVGMTPAQYLLEARLKKAVQLLVFTPKSIEEIAEMAGFPNRNYLTRLFAKKKGCGPAAFRRRFQDSTHQNQA